MYEQGRILESSSAGPTRRRCRGRRTSGCPARGGPHRTSSAKVTDQLVARYGAERAFGGGLEVTTTIDSDLVDKAREAIQKVLRNPDGLAAALVAIDPRTVR